MATKKTPLVIGNWKMNPRTSNEAITLARKIKELTKKILNINIVIAPPLLYTNAVSKVLVKSQLKLAVQHIHPGPVGAFTGEVSPAMVDEFNVDYVIVGHSEKRSRGITDADVQAAVQMILKHRMKPVICIGENDRDEEAKFYSFIKHQLVTALNGIPTSRYRDIVIAYEPIWAIGTGKQATAADVLEMKLFIQKILIELVGRNSANNVTILYGGSVKSDVAANLYREGGVDGFLVGGASLDAAEFVSICQSTL